MRYVVLSYGYIFATFQVKKTCGKKSWMIKIYSENPECKKYIQYSKNFQTKHKLLKNGERWKKFQYSVYSLGGYPCNLG